MAPSDTDDRLASLHRVACEDALFAIAACDVDALDKFAEERAEAHATIATDGIGSSVLMADWVAWRLALTRAIAPIATPWFVPMHDAVARGMSLAHKPRGLRGVLPIGKEAERDRLRREGVFAVRVARAVSAADAQYSDDEARAVDLLIAALALPEDDVRLLAVEAPMPVSAIEIPESVEGKLARAIVAGAWRTAATDGVDESEAIAVESVAQRLRVDAEDVSELRVSMKQEMDAQRASGRALVDVVRHVLAPIPQQESLPIALATVHLATPAIDRAAAERTVLRAADGTSATPLGAAHTLDRGERQRVLAAAWAAALCIDPRASQTARLRARHEHAATVLGGRGDAARELVDDVVRRVMDAGAKLVSA